jgi:transcriptional antiterminator NusG
MENQDQVKAPEEASGVANETEQLATESTDLTPAAVEEAPPLAGAEALPQEAPPAPAVVEEAPPAASAEALPQEAPPAPAADETAAAAVEAPGSSEAQEGAPPQAEVKDDRAWYVVHSYSGYENKVKKNLEHRIESMNVQHKIFQVTVPTEEEIEIKEGRRRKTKRRVFPGYILVQMIMDDDSWYVVRNTPGVTGFVSSGTGNKPSPLRPDEIDKIFSRMEMEAPRIKVSFREGQTVRIVDGPFADFVGTVEEMNLDKGKVRVLVSFFGRETPVELDFLQVQRQ